MAWSPSDFVRSAMLRPYAGHWWYLGCRRRATRRLLLLPLIWFTIAYAWYEALQWVLADRRQFEESVAAARAGQ